MEDIRGRLDYVIIMLESNEANVEIVSNILKYKVYCILYFMNVI